MLGGGVTQLRCMSWVYIQLKSSNIELVHHYTWFKGVSPYKLKGQIEEHGYKFNKIPVGSTYKSLW